MKSREEIRDSKSGARPTVPNYGPSISPCRKIYFYKRRRVFNKQAGLRDQTVSWHELEKTSYVSDRPTITVGVK